MGKIEGAKGVGGIFQELKGKTISAVGGNILEKIYICGG